MPGLDGLETNIRAAQVRQPSADIMITATTNPALKRRAAEIGVKSVLGETSL
jgi:CheY-like chemotaxis protein